jgi:hypothetical protein
MVDPNLHEMNNKIGEHSIQISELKKKVKRYSNSTVIDFDYYKKEIAELKNDHTALEDICKFMFDKAAGAIDELKERWEELYKGTSLLQKTLDIRVDILKTKMKVFRIDNIQEVLLWLGMKVYEFIGAEHFGSYRQFEMKLEGKETEKKDIEEITKNIVDAKIQFIEDSGGEKELSKRENGLNHSHDTGVGNLPNDSKPPELKERCYYCNGSGYEEEKYYLVESDKKLELEQNYEFEAESMSGNVIECRACGGKGTVNNEPREDDRFTVMCSNCGGLVSKIMTDDELIVKREDLEEAYRLLESYHNSLNGIQDSQILKRRTDLITIMGKLNNYLQKKVKRD